MTSKEKLALIKETWYDVDLTDEKYIDFDEEQTFNDLEEDLDRLEKQDNALKILNEYRERIKKRIESLEEYKKYVYDSKNETEYFKTIGSLEAYGKTLDALNEVLDYEI